MIIGITDGKVWALYLRARLNALDILYIQGEKSGLGIEIS